MLSDSRACRTSSQADPRTWTPFQISATSTTTTAEFSAAIDRMRQRIGTARTSATSRERPRAVRLAGNSVVPRWLAVSFNSVDLANSFDQRRRLRIAPDPGINTGHRRFERLAVEVAHDRPARRFRPPARLLLEIFPSLAHEVARFLCGCAKCRLVFRRQTGPGLVRHRQYLRTHRVFGQRVEASVLVVIGSDKGWPVVFRTVDQLGR